MTATVSGGLEALRSAVSGKVCTPEDTDYDDCRRVWNAQVDRKPAVVVMCAGTDDVVAVIAHAREHGLEITVRGGAHNTSGSAVCDGGLMINLAEMNGVQVDPQARRARVGGGALLSDLDGATQQHGLATPGGMISHTGVAGLTLGGGMGWLSRKHGLSIDNLTGAEVVLADGSVVWADEDQHADLFWALRGGGGNFGVVTTFEFALHPVGPMVQLGMFFWAAERGAEALRSIRDIVATLPRELNVLVAALSAPPAPFVPEEHVFSPGYAVILVGFGTAEEHAEYAERIRSGVPPLFEFVSPMPYAALQQMQDEATAWGQLAYEKGTQVADLSEEVIAVLTEHFGKRTSPMSMVMFYRLDAAYSEVPEDATAYGGGRSPRYATMLVAVAHDMDTWTRDRAWVRALWDALQPHSLGIGDYVNNMVEFDEDRIRASYGPDKYARLALIKAKYDPQNTFHRNVNIPPAPVSAEADYSLSER
ncbi:MAG: FAD-binding oxidoreductase [Jatrophihabitantaceae bacterium]